MDDFADIGFVLHDEYTDREANCHEVLKTELIEEGGRFTYRRSREGVVFSEWSGSVGARDPERGLAKLLFDGGAVGFARRGEGANRLGDWNDDYHAWPIPPGRIRIDDSRQWDLFLGYFRAILSAEPGKGIVPGDIVPRDVPWDFCPLEGDPALVGCIVSTGSGGGPFSADGAEYRSCLVELGDGLAVRCVSRMKGGNAAVQLSLVAPASLSQVELHLKGFRGTLDSSLRVCNGLPASKRIDAAREVFSVSHGDLIR